MKRIIIIALTVSLSCSFIKLEAQQIPQFTQYMFNGLYINPAYAGYKGNLYAHLMYRKQWVGTDGAPQTVMLGIDGDLRGGSNLGFVYANDHIGATSTNSFMLSYAFRFNVAEQARLAFGLAGGAMYYGLDKNKADITNPLVMQTRNIWRPQVDVGVYFDTEPFYASLSVMGLISNRIQDSTMLSLRADPTYFLTFGGMISLGENFGIAPSTLLKTDFKSPLSLDINAMVVYADRIWLGASYRTGVNFTYKERESSPDGLRQRNVLAIIAELYVTEQLRLGAAYDFDLNSVTTSYGGGIEVSLGYYMMRSRKYYSTPRHIVSRRW